jgi:hypothetical protein
MNVHGVNQKGRTVTRKRKKRLCFQLFAFISIKHARQIETVGLSKNKNKNFNDMVNNSNGVEKYTGKMHIDIGSTGNTNQRSASFAQRQPEFKQPTQTHQV